MAYAERMPSRTRSLTVITVAGLHGMALYGLVTGLGVDYVTDKIAILQGRNIPVDPVPVPPPPPEVKPVEQAVSNASHVQIPTIVDVAPNPFNRGERIDVVDLKPIERVTLDPVGPTVFPTQDKPAFAARSARPRNDPGSWVSTDDYPGASLVRGEQGTVRFEVAVGADGRVSDCRVTASSGSSDLDAATCRFVTRRARFDPAIDGSGARVSGTYPGSIRWVIPRD